MKEFVRFLITILILTLVGGTIYYTTVINGNKNIVNENATNQTNDDKTQVNDLKEPNEDLNESHSYEYNVTFEQTQCLTMNMGKELLGNNVNDLLDVLEVNEIPVIFQRVRNNNGTKITIMPMSDFVDNQEFVYDVNGNLLLYTTISTTVGGNVQYHFSNNILVQTINNMEEFVVPVYEEQDEILARASRLYNL